ncbi:MAG: rhomboid family intramembrane serine protease [Gammaproteobacteria bacterium]
MAGFTSSYSLLPPVVRTLLIANGLMFIFELSYGEPLITALALWPLGQSGSLPDQPVQQHFQLLQLVSYSFLHGSVMHLFLNMYALWLFGTRMENVWGSVAFTVYYFVCVIGAGLVQLLVSALSGDYYPTVGASGGIFGLLLAFGMRFPNEVLLLVFPPVALPAKWFVTIYAGIELFAGVTGTAAGVAHFAHLGGMLFGYLLIRYWRMRPPGAR